MNARCCSPEQDPKHLRERFALHPESEIEFCVERGELVLRKKRAERGRTRRAKIEACIGALAGEPPDVDAFIEDIRGR